MKLLRIALWVPAILLPFSCGKPIVTKTIVYSDSCKVHACIQPAEGRSLEACWKRWNDHFVHLDAGEDPGQAGAVRKVVSPEDLNRRGNSSAALNELFLDAIRLHCDTTTGRTTRNIEWCQCVWARFNRDISNAFFPDCGVTLVSPTNNCVKDGVERGNEIYY